MERGLILVEGQTEEAFVDRLLAPHLLARGLSLKPVILKTKRLASGKSFKGGASSYDKIRRDLLLLLRDSNVVCVTTMLDFYGFPKDLPGRSPPLSKDPRVAVECLEKDFAADLEAHRPRFLPFLVLHEFEALLLAAPAAFDELFPGLEVTEKLVAAVKARGSPELVNDGEATHPAARISLLVKGYEKVKDGAALAERIGLETMREQCPHFDGWVQRLEALTGDGVA